MKMSFFYKDKEQEGKRGPVWWGFVTVGEGEI
jgi:hypothetical protein